MESRITTCVICCESYNDGARKPLLLPCNHTFCKNCLQTLENSRNKECALCKKGWKESRVTNLPILYQLIPPESSAQGTTHDVTCGPHVEKATFWCESCIVPICNTCLDEKHRTCNFLMIQKYRGKEDYQKALIDLLKNETRNSERVQIFDCFDHKVRSQKEKHLMWEKKSQKVHAKFKDICDEQQGEQANPKLYSNRKEAQESYENLNDDVPTDTLLFHMARAYQETNDLRIETFIRNLRQSAGKDPEPSLSPTASASQENTVSSFRDGEVWTVSDTTAGSKATHVLCTTRARPSHLLVTGVHWFHDELITLLLEISAVYCTVQVQFLDIFWSPDKESAKTTQLRLETLLKPEHKCTVTQFWGHLNEEGVKKLPTTIQSVGLILRAKEDLKATKALLRVAFERPFFGAAKKKWMNLSVLNLCFFKTFGDRNGLLVGQWNADACKLIAICSTFNINFGLHFPYLNLGDILWINSIILEVTSESSHRQRIKDIYFPGTYMDANNFLEMLKCWEIQCRVHLPSHQLNDSDVVRSYSAIGCSVFWDLEAIFPTNTNCVIM